jgi:hypothetical protein
MKLTPLTDRVPKLIACAVMLAIASATAAEQGTTVSPQVLVRQTVENEIKSGSGDLKFMFRDHKETVHGSQTKLIVETSEGAAGMLVAIDGAPLTPGQRRAEFARLDRLVHNPEELRRKQRAEREDADRTLRIVKALPDAFLYFRDGSEVGRDGTGTPGQGLVRLEFHPNPKYSPPSRAEQVLTGMQGYMLIDENRHRLALIDGKLFKDVSFGWGILGHLDKGGHFLVQQASVENGDWEITRMDLSFRGRELLFKRLTIESNEVFSDFHSVPSNLTFAQAVELLKKQSAELASTRQ